MSHSTPKFGTVVISIIIKPITLAKSGIILPQEGAGNDSLRVRGQRTSDPWTADLFSVNNFRRR